MNSKSLKKNHEFAYQKFFLQNQLILSTPFVMNRSGDILNNYSGVGIKQKLPLRLYAGCTRNTSGKITLGTFSYFDLNENTFMETNALEYTPYMSTISDYLQKTYSHLLKGNEGLEINFLSELPRGAGLGFGSLIALVISLLINRVDNTITAADLLTLKKQNINEVINNSYSPFYKIYLDAMELDKHIYSMVSSGTKLASFFDSHYPIVSFSQDFDKSSSHIDLHTNRYFGFRCNELFPGLKDIPYAPIDYGILYTGKPVLLEQIAGNQYKNNIHLAKTIKSECVSWFGDALGHIAPSQRPRFYKTFIDPETDEFDTTYGRLMGSISLKLLHYMGQMYCDGYDETTMRNFLNTIVKIRQGDAVTRDGSYTFSSFVQKCIEQFKQSAKNIALAPNDSSIMGGSLIFAMPLEGFRKPFLDAIHQVNSEYAGASLLYTNWIDGGESEGSKIEQDLKQGLCSQFLATNNCVIKRLDGKVTIGDCEKSIDQHKTGLLLDVLNNKMYLDGQKLTSQDLHSQSATIEIMKRLIENPDTDIPNKDFPLSTYSKNKNEMLGKIVIPLIDLIEKKTGKRLQLICKGSIYDFYLKLKPSDIQIALIEKRQK